MLTKCILLSTQKHFKSKIKTIYKNNKIKFISSESKLPVIKSFIVDTLQLMKNFEKIGFTRDQSERLTEEIKKLVEGSQAIVAKDHVLKTELEKSLMEQDSKINAFKSELQKAQDLHLSNVGKDTERLQSSLEKLKTDIKHDIDKLTASQRLDLNLEKGRMRDELQGLRDKANDLELKMDREINALKAANEQVKNETIKYVVAIMGTFTAAAVGLARLFIK